MSKGGLSTEYSKEIGSLASDLRRQRGLSQEAVAELAEVSQALVSKLEIGKSVLPEMAIKVLYSLATSESGLGEVDALVAAIPPLAQEMEFQELVNKVGDTALATAPHMFSKMIAEKLGMKTSTVYQRLRNRRIIPS